MTGGTGRSPTTRLNCVQPDVELERWTVTLSSSSRVAPALDDLRVHVLGIQGDPIELADDLRAVARLLLRPHHLQE